VFGGGDHGAGSVVKRPDCRDISGGMRVVRRE